MNLGQQQYPAAYKVYDQHCKITPHEKLIGTCQLIPPQRKDYERPATTSLPPSKRRKVEKVDDEGVGQAPTTQRKNWIACLFTSVGYGKSTKKHPGRDKPDVILGNTRKTLVDLREKLLELGIKDKKGEDELDPKVKAVADEDAPGELWSCRFNGGLFAVDWADTRKVLEDEMKGLGKTVLVVRPAES